MKYYNLILLGLLLLCLAGCKAERTERPLPGQRMMSASALSSNEPANVADTESVYICKSTSAARYHYDEDCPGIKRCKHTIEKSTVKKAEAIGLTLCKLEY